MLEEVPFEGEAYNHFLKELKSHIQEAQVRAGLAINRELVLLYWHIGKSIFSQQQSQGWGAKVINRLADDLHKAFPDVKGFSARNLKYMRAFAENWTTEESVQQLAAQIPWFHNCVLLDKVKEPEARQWYIMQTIEHGWSRSVLVHQIERNLHLRQSKAINNFGRVLPAAQSELAQQVLKDPYNFDFLTLGNAVQERELERGLTKHIRNFLLELGAGFAFVGSQYHLEIDGQDFYIDLLFYHLHLRCYIVIDLKVTDFEPEFAGKMSFYLTAVDTLIRHPNDEPAIGLIICKGRNKTIVEYTLRDMVKPIGVATYQISESLPEKFKGQLPTIEELEAEVNISTTAGEAK